MSITAAMVKELRETSGAGMMDCKAALKETGGDMEAAVDWLRTKGLAKAAKKAGRVAAEGLVAVAADGNKAVVVEVNSETDFVARNENFQKLVRDIAATALTVDGDVEKLAAAPYPGSDKSVEGELKEAVGTIGENMTLRRSAGLSVSEGVVASYMHNAAGDGLGKIGVLVALESAGDADKLAALGKQIAMHVAATNPMALNTDELDADAVERERTVYMEQARESGKPESIIEKMVEGRLRKFYEEVTLVKQSFVINPDLTVEKAVEETAKEIGSPIKLTGFVRIALGEGIEKEESDFAAEVAAAAGN
ncbi:Elongation factor Ts [Pseudovibrio sp. W64]|jgi:elongation factor Ts|uniref:Elongation factor Ts n=1 Tax=Pseudovibrio ascidiaceicola TaxID=285279 RepID=A0A1I4BYJ0_9HYPH|nr:MULTISPECIES: translation elongation factor Ts [Pseudovibrio]KZK76212.1 Elongation factor Ts [Pseudovibrio sp. W64]KZK80798.1 Elongation factor Ts [Pseudovibrio sp. Ad46]KZK96531.1 Elongation factor Ts [Pseudovibrio sp. Ad5]KZL00354.1 Elongation factor Ts [Pseudovibrio sp. W74]KZL06280.1 Elongation factor Ts [Pseudovibrio sp. Ad26]